MNKQILLIDDDIDELYIFKEALNEMRNCFECMYADTVVEGLKILKNVLPDFIFLDINMPKINGLEGLLLIKKMKIFQNIPVILYSTAISEEINEKALALGAAGCIRKTGSIKTLSEVLVTLFDRSASLQQEN